MELKLHMLRSKFISLLLLATLAFAYFSPKQLEILDLHYKIQPKKSNGEPTRNFYSILNVPANVDEEQLEKAYKKLSRKWHPDKFVRAEMKERRKAERKFETLSLVMSILRDVERRKNYDYFLKRGFPVWDENKSRYVFKNRSKPTFKVVIVSLLVFATLAQIVIKKLNTNQKNKRIEKILRDVRWKADNMSKQDNQTNKIMELPDDFEMGSMSIPSYSIDDKLVTYCGRVFIVKPDRSVLLYNDESIDTENQQEMNDLVKKIIDSGHFNLYGFQKKPTNRKERRQQNRESKKGGASDEDDILDLLVQFRTEESSLKLSDLLVFKIPIKLWNIILGQLNTIRNFENLSSGSCESKTPHVGGVEKETREEGDDEQEKEAKKEGYEIVNKPRDSKDGKIVLPNGKVLHSRRK